MLSTGAPDDDATDVGPLIDERAAVRVEQWIDEAVAGGATARRWRTSGGRCRAHRDRGRAPRRAGTDDEVFGPVVALSWASSSDEDAFEKVNESRFGLQAGFSLSANLQTAFRASRVLNVGGVIVGDVPSYRADAVRGREGLWDRQRGSPFGSNGRSH